MQIYLPIAEISINIFLLLGLGAGVGFLSGIFGVGGGFLMTPLLIFIGIPPAVAVSTQANQVIASSASGALTHWRRQAIDIKMGLLLLIGGSLGSVLGVFLFTWLRTLGQIDLFVSLAYVALLSIIGGLMLVESVNALRKKFLGKGDDKANPRRKRRLIDRLPFKVRFARSGLYISVIPPLFMGFSVGALAAMLGIGGGFIMLPAMIYILRMPANVVVGTSLFQILFVTALTTYLQAAQNQTVDIVLALTLIVGGVIGAQFGARLGQRLPAEELRTGLALLVLGVGVKLAWDLGSEPSDMFEIIQTGVK
ncbi:sulfite exporter TauE/SafE family protein [Woodsholea maritima]|uniref:sulfite exporter TauE/SafE family protein n=1 Tax=Woodsholea maritima TaxID=240237 RepID=UPI000377CB6A|nr:sulfite exporter TauE/SafE family protein [Woodsholea maritima]